MLVGELARRSDVLPLSFHVDYWDDLGWRDRFSSSEATQRQRNYARALGRSSVYTPEAIIDGHLDIVGSQRQAITAALAKPRDGVAVTLKLTAGALDVAVDAQQGAAHAQVLLVGYLRQVTTQIGRGENSGRTLQESNVVRSLRILGTWEGQSVAFHVAPHSLPDDVTDAAVLVQSSGQGLIFGAATQPLR
jgi:hypothetical protein